MIKDRKTVEVVAAIIEYNNKILCVQRGESKLTYISKKYEFPGGKIEEGESYEETIIREIDEELKMKIKPIKRFLTVNHAYPDFDLIMHSFRCSCLNSQLTLTEHIDFKWMSIDRLNSLDWAAADIPIVNELVK